MNKETKKQFDSVERSERKKERIYFYYELRIMIIIY